MSLEKNLPAINWEGFNQMPDKGVLKFVRDALAEEFQIDVDQLPDHWIPIGVVGVLDWVMICGWWIYRNTGIFESDEPYKYVFDYGGYEFDPDMLQMFKEEEERLKKKLEERWAFKGIDGLERTEALQFLMVDVYGMWAREKGVRAEDYAPPQMFVEMLMWASFVWILEYGRDWIYTKDEVFACVYEFSVAYLAKWDGALLDPNIMVRQDRPKNSCRYCGKVLWCVRGAYIEDVWQFICNNCYVSLQLEGRRVEVKDARLTEPSCPHFRGVDGKPGSCTATCPHSGVTQEKVWEKMEKAGTERVEKYRDFVREMGGHSPRVLSGQTEESILNFFK